jgi:hypothetical protein
VVETIRLESGHTLTGIVGSNPTLSARNTAGGSLTLRNFAARLTFPSPGLFRQMNNPSRYLPVSIVLFLAINW